MGQKYPAAHCPEQLDDVSSVRLPKVPASHGEHAAAPATLNCPRPHGTAVADVEPLGHAQPAVHEPEHSADVRRSVEVEPKRPPGQSLHTLAPPVENLPATQPKDVFVEVPIGQKNPGGHTTAVALLEPAGHQKPSAQRPAQFDVLVAIESPNRPAGQRWHVD